MKTMLSEARKRAKDRGENMMNDEVNAIMAPLNDLKVSFKDSPWADHSER